MVFLNIAKVILANQTISSLDKFFKKNRVELKPQELEVLNLYIKKNQDLITLKNFSSFLYSNQLDLDLSTKDKIYQVLKRFI